MSYTGCANFSFRHHSSKHILGVIWGEYALLGQGKEGVRAHPPSPPGCCFRTPTLTPLSSHFCPTSDVGPGFYLNGRWASACLGNWNTK